MNEELQGGLTREELEDYARNISGQVCSDGTGIIVSKRGVISPTRLGTTREPDSFGTATSPDRPENIGKALERLDRLQTSLLERA